MDKNTGVHIDSIDLHGFSPLSFVSFCYQAMRDLLGAVFLGGLALLLWSKQQRPCSTQRRRNVNNTSTDDTKERVPELRTSANHKGAVSETVWKACRTIKSHRFVYVELKLLRDSQYVAL